MLQVVNFKVYLEGVEAGVARRHAQVDDIGFVKAEYSCHLGQHSGAVVNYDAQTRRASIAALPPA